MRIDKFIIETVQEICEVEDLTIKNKDSRVIEARQMAMTLMFEVAKMQQSTILSFLGYKSNSSNTVNVAIHSTKQRIKYSPWFAEEYTEAERRVREWRRF